MAVWRLHGRRAVARLKYLVIAHLPPHVGDNIPESCAEYQLRLRCNYRDKDMPRYDLIIAIFDMIRYIVPSLMICML